MTVMRSPSKLRIPAVTAFAVAVVLVPWLSRNVIPLDVCFRLLLPIVWLSVWSLACLGPGKAIMALLLPSRTEIPGVMVMLIGSAVLAFLGFLLAAAGILRPMFLNGVLGCAAIGGIFVLLKQRESIRFVPEGLFSPLSLVLVIPIFLTMFVLTTPPVMYDVLHYHLAFPEQWLRAGSFIEFPRESFSYYPSAHGMLFSYALAAIGPWGANAINWWMGLMSALAAAELSRRYAGPMATPWAAASFLLTPAVLEISGYATADLTVAAWTGGALLFLLRKDGAFPNQMEMLMGGFFVGSAAAAKYLAMATVCLPLMLVLIYLGLRDRIRWKTLATGIAFLLVGLGLSLGPWLLRNMVWAGNPVYPYLHAVFGGDSSSLDLGRELERTMDISASTGKQLMLSMFALIRRSFNPRLEGGVLGSHWLILLIAAAGFSSISRLKWPLWIFLMTGCVTWGFLVQYVRFLLPALVAGAALAGGGMAVLLGEVGPLARRSIVALFIFLFSWSTTVLATPFFSQRLAVVCGQLDELEFRKNWDSRTDALGFIQRSLPEHAVLLLVGELRSFGLNRRVFVDGPYHRPLLVDLAQNCDSAEALAEELRDLGVTHLLVNRREMPRLAGLRKVPDYWSPAGVLERRLLDDFFKHELRPLFEKDGVGVYRLQYSASSNLRVREAPQTVVVGLPY